MSSAVIGALRTVFGADTAAFEDGVDKVERKIKKTKKTFVKFGQKLSGIGKTMSIGITAPLLALGAGSLKAGADHALGMAQVKKGLETMGDASGKSLEELRKTSEFLEDNSNFNADEVLSKVTANMLTFGNVSGDVFDRAQRAALDMSARLDDDLKGSTIRLGKALNDPIKGVSALADVGVQFSAVQIDMIKGMVKAGDVAGAQGLILEELERQYKGSAKAAQDAVPGSDAQDAYAQFSRVVGEFALQVLPPLSAALTKLLNKFTDLSPGMQKTVLVAGALLAAVGPVVTVIGSLITILAPLSAAIVVVTGATSAWGAAVAIALGPIGLIVAAITAATLAYKTFSPALRDNKEARDELYGVIGENDKLLKREQATTIAGARAQIMEAKAIRENIKARLEQQEALLKKQVKSFVLLNSNNVGRGLGQLGLNKKISENMAKTGAAVRDARQALKDNDDAAARLNATLLELGGTADGVAGSTTLLTEAQLAAKNAKEEAAKAARKSASEVIANHKAVIAETKEEVAENERLTAALKTSQREYEITALMIGLVKDGHTGATSAVRALAVSLLDSQTAFKAAQDAATAEKAAIDAVKEAAIQKADEIVKAAERAAQAHNGVVMGVKEELEANRLLAEAVRISSLEYDIVYEKLRLLEAGFKGTAAEARKMAEDLVASRNELGELTAETQKAEDALNKTGEAGAAAFAKTLDSFQGLIQGIKDGDLEGILDGVLGLFDQLFGGGGGSSGGGILEGLGSIFGGGSGGGDGGSILDGLGSLFGGSAKTQGSSLFSPSSASSSTKSSPLSSLFKLDVVPSPFFDTQVTRISAQTASPIAQVTTVQGVSEYNRVSAQRARQSLKRRG